VDKRLEGLLRRKNAIETEANNTWLQKKHKEALEANASQKCQRHPPSMTPVVLIGRGILYQKKSAHKITKTKECTCMGG
jgi:L-fucose mutarotase/ribose pyranase (RbsD/FucU family)